MKTVLIEDVSKSPVEWGISLTSSNPEHGDYFVCADKYHAEKLSEILDVAFRMAEIVAHTTEDTHSSNVLLGLALSLLAQQCLHSDAPPAPESDE